MAAVSKLYQGGDFLLEDDSDFLYERLLGWNPKAHVGGKTKQVFDIPLTNLGTTIFKPYDIVQPYDETTDFGYKVDKADGNGDFYLVVGPTGLGAGGRGLGSLAYDPVWVGVGDWHEKYLFINLNYGYAQNTVGPNPNTQKVYLYNRGFYTLSFLPDDVLHSGETFNKILAVQRLYYNDAKGTYRENAGILDLPIKYPGKFLVLVDAVNTPTTTKLIGNCQMILNKNGDEVHRTGMKFVDGIEYHDNANVGPPPGTPTPPDQWPVLPWMPYPLNLSIAMPLNLLPGEDELDIAFDGDAIPSTLQITASVLRVGPYDEGI